MPMPSTQAVSFGARTRVGYGGRALGYTGAGTLSIASGNGAGHWTIDTALDENSVARNHLVPANGAGAYGSAPPAFAGPYTLVITDGTESTTVTIAILANAMHARALPGVGANADFTYGSTPGRSFQINGYVSNNANVSLGDTIWCRDGYFAKDRSSGTVQARPPSGFYTNGTGRITIRSENPDTTIDANGVPNRKHGFIMAPFSIDGTLCGNDSVLPIDFRDIWFEGSTALHKTRKVAFSSATAPVGVSYYNCRASNSDDMPEPNKGDGLIVNGGGVGTAYCEDCRFENNGKTIFPANGAVVRRSYGLNNNDDYISMDGSDLLIEDNFACNIKYTVGSAAHPDFIQHNKLNAGVVSDNVVIRRNAYARNVGTPGYIDAQFIFCDDTDPTAQRLGLVIENNLGLHTMANGIFTDKPTNPMIRRNLNLSDVGADDGQTYFSTLYVPPDKGGTGGTITNNVSSAINVDAQVGATVSNNISLGRNLTAYTTAFPNFTRNIASMAQMIAALTPANLAVASGGMRNPDGTFNGPLFPDGSWNNGGVYAPGAGSTALSGRAIRASVSTRAAAVVARARLLGRSALATVRSQAGDLDVSTTIPGTGRRPGSGLAVAAAQGVKTMGVPSDAKRTAYTMDPSDVVDVVYDPRLLLNRVSTPDEVVTSDTELIATFTLTMSAEGAAAGLTIRNDTGRVPSLVNNAGSIRFWLSVDPSAQQLALFDDAGVALPITVRWTTTNVPSRTFERTLLATVRQR